MLRMLFAIGGTLAAVYLVAPWVNRRTGAAIPEPGRRAAPTRRGTGAAVVSENLLDSCARLAPLLRALRDRGQDARYDAGDLVAIGREVARLT